MKHTKKLQSKGVSMTQQSEGRTERDRPSTAKERVTVRFMLKRWREDLALLDKILGPYTTDDVDDRAEIQRNLGTAIVWANSFVVSLNRAALSKTESRS